MKKKILLPIAFGITASIILIIFASPLLQKPISLNEKPTPVNDISSNRITFSYVDSNSIMKSTLSSKGISMSKFC